MEKHRICQNVFLLFVIVMAFGGIVIHAAADIGDAKRVFPENDTEGYHPVDILVIDPSIRTATHQYDFLIMSDEGKQNWLSNLDADIDYLYPDDLRREEMKTRMKNNLLAIWDKYPVVFEKKPGNPGYPTYGGSFITVRFAPHLENVRLTDEETDAILESAAILNKAYTTKYPDGYRSTVGDPMDSPGNPVTQTRATPLSGIIPLFALGVAAIHGAVIRYRRSRDYV